MNLLKNEVLSSLRDSPIVAAIKNFEGLKACLQSDCQVVFVLFGDICNIGEIIETLKQAGKIVIVHIDLIDGLSHQAMAIEYLKRHTLLDGIISTKPSQIKYAKSIGMITVQRFFLLDSMALENVIKKIDLGYADFIEVLPGAMPKIIRKIVSSTHVPTIAGGLISDKEDIVSLLSMGATAISSTNEEVWFM